MKLVNLLRFLAITPFLLVLLIIVDIVFLILSVVITPTILVASIFKYHDRLTFCIEEFQDKTFNTLFGMQKMDVEGFRRLRTSSQFSFETIPQIILQIRILLNLWGNQTELESLGISITAISVSITFAVMHACLEAQFINLEAKANKTSLLHYLIICFNGRFGYVPFSHYFVRDSHINDEIVFDFDNISSSVCCMNFKMGFTFTNDSVSNLSACLTNLPIKSWYDLKLKIVAGECLNKISI